MTGEIKRKRKKTGHKYIKWKLKFAGAKQELYKI